MEYILAYGAGLLTLINPCVLPILPIVLAGALQANPRGPLALAAGMVLTFVTLGVTITAFGHAIGLTEARIGQAGASLMIIFGLILLLPPLRRRFSAATSGLANSADSNMNTLDQGTLRGQFVGGMLLGAVWSPCVGPTLGGAIALASTGDSLFHVTAIMIAFGAGIASIMLGLAYGARAYLMRNRDRMRKIATASQPILGAVFIFVGTAILMRWHHIVEAWLLNHMPDWLINLSVTL